MRRAGRSAAIERTAGAGKTRLAWTAATMPAKVATASPPVGGRGEILRAPEPVAKNADRMCDAGLEVQPVLLAGPDV